MTASATVARIRVAASAAHSRGPSNRRVARRGRPAGPARRLGRRTAPTGSSLAGPIRNWAAVEFQCRFEIEYPDSPYTETLTSKYIAMEAKRISSPLQETQDDAAAHGATRSAHFCTRLQKARDVVLLKGYCIAFCVDNDCQI